MFGQSVFQLRWTATAVTLMLLLWGVLMSATAQADFPAARQFIDTLGDRVLAVVQDKAITDNAKEDTLRGMFLETMDVDWIGRFVLGQYWRQASEEQKTEYTALYRTFLIKTYVSRFREYTGETFKIIDARQTDPGEYTVYTVIERPKAENVRVDYRVREEGKSFRVFDIIVEGVSLLATQRSEFGSVIQRQGLEGFLKKLDARVKKLSQQAGAPSGADASPAL